jgi:acyl-CoA-dependent ceramide synthase
MLIGIQTSKILNYLESPIVIPYFILFLFSWAYLRHFINLKILFSLLPLPMPFSDHINEQILSTLSSASTTTSSAFATVEPVLAPVIKLADAFFPETVSLLRSLPARTTSFLNTPSDFATIGPYVLNWETQQYKCPLSQYITFFLLLALQLVNMFWFFLILRILWRIVASGFKEAEDERSVDDEEEVDERAGMLEELRSEQKGDAWGGETGADIRGDGTTPEIKLNGVTLGEKENGRAH